VTRLPDQPGRRSDAWAPDAESHEVLDLAHAAPPAPPQLTSAESAAAESEGVRIAPGPRFGTGHTFDDHLRLPFNHPREALVRACEVLARSARELAPARGVRERGTIV